MTERRFNLWVVEDDPKIRALLVSSLSRTYSVRPFCSADDVVEYLTPQGSECENPDLALVDIMLPGELDGVDLACKLHALGIPTVALSAALESDTLRRFQVAGGSVWVNKPFLIRDVEVALASVLKSAG